jgi:protein phosphatase
VVCSDGLTNELSDTEIGLLLADCADPQQAADQLVERAVLAGGRDNVTVIVVQLDEADQVTEAGD